MERCDYCGRGPVAGAQLKMWQLLRWGRFRVLVERRSLQVCLAHLSESGAPLSAAQIQGIAEAMRRNQDEDER